APGADPDAAVAVGMQRKDGVIEAPILNRMVGEVPVLEAAQAAVGANPDAALLVLAQRRDKIIRQAVFCRVRRDLPILEPDHPAPVRTRPQTAVIALDQRPDFAFFQLAAVKGGKTHSVEAGEAAFRRHPDVSVARLQNAENRVLW